jgi:hypothetical protein
MASVDPKIIQDIRIRKQAQELIKKADEFKAMRDRLVELSGIKERGINPDEININEEYLPTLLKAAEEFISKDESLTEALKSDGDVKPARARRQTI